MALKIADFPFQGNPSVGGFKHLFDALRDFRDSKDSLRLHDPFHGEAKRHKKKEFLLAAGLLFALEWSPLYETVLDHW